MECDGQEEGGVAARKGFSFPFFSPLLLFRCDQSPVAKCASREQTPQQVSPDLL